MSVLGPEVGKLRVILTGATGLVGEGVLLECLENQAVERVLVVGRRSCGREHPKLREVIVDDLRDAGTSLQELSGYDACFYCAGVSSRGMSEDDYTRNTYETPVRFASQLLALNPRMTFVHVSGNLTDSSEKGPIMWARVKGRAENALAGLGFARVYNFRPGFMKPTAGHMRVKTYYHFMGCLYPFLRLLAPNQVSTMREVGLAMINAVLLDHPTSVLEIREIKALAVAVGRRQLPR
jgi:uncharacterized protein YbjT (DUF2867 family)